MSSSSVMMFSPLNRGFSLPARPAPPAVSAPTVLMKPAVETLLSRWRVACGVGECVCERPSRTPACWRRCRHSVSGFGVSGLTKAVGCASDGGGGALGAGHSRDWPLRVGADRAVSRHAIP
eukprot:3469425-Rhodomonas_salina.2